MESKLKHLELIQGVVNRLASEMRTAALDTESREPEHGYALGYESVKRGVREASRIRVREIQEAYPWVREVLGVLEGMVAPCGLDETAGQWRRARVLDRLAEEETRHAAADGRLTRDEVYARVSHACRMRSWFSSWWTITWDVTLSAPEIASMSRPPCCMSRTFSTGARSSAANARPAA